MKLKILYKIFKNIMITLAIIALMVVIWGFLISTVIFFIIVLVVEPLILFAPLGLAAFYEDPFEDQHNEACNSNALNEDNHHDNKSS